MRLLSVFSLVLAVSFPPYGAAVLDSGPGPDSGASRLWYRQPARDWNEALPVGNGRLGAMVFGEPAAELIRLNEETLWAGCPINNNNPEALGNLPAVRRALFDGEVEAASALAEKTMLGTPPRIRSYQPLGDLRLDSGGERNLGQGGKSRAEAGLKFYQRSLALREGIAGVAFETADGRRSTREIFASAVDDILVVRLLAGPGTTVDVRVRLAREKDATTSVLSSGELVMTGQIVDPPDPPSGPEGKHMRFAARLVALPEGGRVTADPAGTSLLVENAEAVTLLLAAATDYDPDHLALDPSIDPLARCAAVLDRARHFSPLELRARHVAEHSAMFDRVSLELGDDGLSNHPTDVRLERLRNGAEDPGLAGLYFQYGRYLLMGSSRRPAVLPANLQGIWNKDFDAAWNSDFHTNINLQMNYWPAEVANLPEAVAPLADFLRRLVVPGRVTARDMYGARGWTLHHLTDPFGRTGVADGVWGISPLAGPWIAITLWDHYEFTRDEKFLRETAYPVLKGAAEFVVDFLVPSPEGWLVTAPSHSPENAFIDPRTGKPAMLTYGATIDFEIIHALFASVVRTSEILGVDRDLAQRLGEVQKKLPPFRVGRHGTIQEWIQDFEEHEPGHRHMSQLLGLYPLALFTPEKPELFAAAGKTIARRLAHGGGQTGWSRAWIVSFYARLLDGERAHENLLALLRKSTLTNLFDTHPPFQIDGNFGGTAAIAEMLIQSHRGFIKLLPALPKAWKNGRAKGLVARGAFEVGLTWRDGRIERVEVLSKRGQVLRLANPFLGRRGEVRVVGAAVGEEALKKEIIEVQTQVGLRVVFSSN